MEMIMSLFNQYASEVEQFVKVCHRLADHMFVTSHGGNLAWRLDDDVILITPTKMYKSDIGNTDVVFINMAGDTIEGHNKPTGEKPMYLKFFEQRTDIQSVLHCHPPYTCAASIMKGQNWLMRPLFPEACIEVGPVPVVPYAEPLTQQLADNFEPFLKKYNAFIMENHGLVTMSRGDIYWTLMGSELLEGTAQSLIAALGSGQGVKELSRQDVINLGNVMKTRNLPLFGAEGVNENLEELYFD